MLFRMNYLIAAKSLCPNCLWKVWRVFPFLLAHSMISFWMASIYVAPGYDVLSSVHTETQQTKAAGESLSVIIALCLFTEASVRREVCIHGNRLWWEAAAQSDPERCESDAVPPWRPAGGSDEGWFDVAACLRHWDRNRLTPSPTSSPSLSWKRLCIVVMLAPPSFGMYGYSCVWSPRITWMVEEKWQLGKKLEFQ